jgi:cold shock CspA family protein
MTTGTVTQWNRGTGLITPDAGGKPISLHWMDAETRDREPERMFAVGERVSFELSYGKSRNSALRVRRIAE